MAVTVPYFLLVPFLWVIPESMTWLLAHGKISDIIIILTKISKRNKKATPIFSPFVKDEQSTTIQRNTNPCDLFNTKEMALTTLLQGVAWFTVSMCFYGILMGSGDLTTGSVYVNFVLTSVAELPAYLFSCYALDRFGKKNTVMCSAGLGAISCFVVTTIPKQGDWNTFRLVTGVLARLFVATSFISVYPWGIDLFPAAIISQGLGFTAAMAKFGNVVSPWVMTSMKQLHHFASWLTLGLFLSIMTFSLIKLPEKRINLEIDDIKDELLENLQSAEKAKPGSCHQNLSYNHEC